MKLGRLEDGGGDGFLVVTGGSASLVGDGVGDGFLVVTGGSASLIEDGGGF